MVLCREGLALTNASLFPQGDKEEQGHREEPESNFLPALYTIPSLLYIKSLACADSSAAVCGTHDRRISCGICTAGQTWHMGVSAGVQELAIHQQPSCYVCLCKHPQMRGKEGERKFPPLLYRTDPSWDWESSFPWEAHWAILSSIFVSLLRMEWGLLWHLIYLPPAVCAVVPVCFKACFGSSVSSQLILWKRKEHFSLEVTPSRSHAFSSWNSACLYSLQRSAASSFSIFL